MLTRAVSFVLLLLPACRTDAAPTTTDPAHQAGPASATVVDPARRTGPAVVTEDLMKDRLEEVARQYPDAVIERLGLSDVVFPLDAAESKRLNGYTIVLITATTQNPEELPPARAYVLCGETERDAIGVVWRKGIIDASWSSVVGRFRYDGLFLIPLEVVGKPECQLMMDYAKNRSGQLLQVFDIGIPADVLVLPATDLPTEAAIRALVEREYPFVVTQ